MKLIDWTWFLALPAVPHSEVPRQVVSAKRKYKLKQQLHENFK
jgi:hypothetical protein